MPTTDATTVLMHDPNHSQARRTVRIDEDGNRRVTLLPPAGYGDMWNGSAR